MQKPEQLYSAFVTLFVDSKNGDKAIEKVLVVTNHATSAKSLAEVAAYTRLTPVTEQSKQGYGSAYAFVRVYECMEVRDEDYKVLAQYLEPKIISKQQIDAWWDFKATH